MNTAPEIHNRMPAMVKPETWPVWLGEQPVELPQLKRLLAPYPAGGITVGPVSTRVGNARTTIRA
jgi:putative SOS response-associated peptidase YedK